ncbi:MAG: hypothetical protein ACT4PS_01065 [Betaproteobacteria bacterium]
MKWFLRAAAQGDGQAMVYLGRMFVGSPGVPRDGDAAARWFRRASGDGWPLFEWNEWLAGYEAGGRHRD